MNRFPSSLLMTLVCSQAAFAQPHHAHDEIDQRHHGKHVHGAATLNVAVDGAEVELSFEAPALNIVGFERPPHTPKQRQEVQRAMETLRDVRKVVRLSHDAGCSVSEAKVESPMAEPHAMPADHGHQPVQEHVQGHDEHADKHPPLVNEQDTDQDQHAGFLVTYRLTCQQPQQLSRIDVEAFETFPSLEAIQVQWVTGQQQGGEQLSKSKPSVQLQR